MLDYSYWTSRLAGEPVDHPDAPQPGRYRLPARRTNTTGNVNTRPPRSLPVAIWEDDFAPGKLVVRVGAYPDMHEGSDKFLEFIDRGWPQCKAVTTEEYDRVVAGGSWSDEHDAVTRTNNAPPENSFEGLRDAIEDLAREAADLIEAGPAKTKEETDRAADLANRLGELQGKADKARRAEKIPHENAAKAVDARWRPLTDAANVYRNIKAAVITPFLAAQKRAEEEAKFRAMTTGTPERALPAAKATAGTRGRPVSLRAEKHVEIEDIDAVFGLFRDNPEVRDLLTRLATRAVRAGGAVPGVRVHETEIAA